MPSSKSNSMFLLVLGSVFLPYGLFCLLVPGFLAGAAGVAGTTPTGVTEIRAMYGGLQSAMGVLLLVAARDERLSLAALASVAFVLPGLASARLVGILLDGGLSVYTIGALAFEVISGVLAVGLLRSRLALDRG